MLLRMVSVCALWGLVASGAACPESASVNAGADGSPSDIPTQADVTREDGGGADADLENADITPDDVGEEAVGSDAATSGDIGLSDAVAPMDGGASDAKPGNDRGGLPPDTIADTMEPQDGTGAQESDVSAGEDGTASWPDNAVEGQCASNADCSSGLCNAAAPGGLCQGCGGTCEGNYACNFGTCNQYCSGDDDCPIGLRCLSSQGVCVSVSCTGNDACAAPYVCGSGQCQRPACDPDGCPLGWSCSAGYCVEPYWSL